MAEQGAMRVSDADRERVAERLVRAHGEGRLTLVEYDERVRAAHGAVVRDDLAPLLADLPGGSSAGGSSAGGMESRGRSRRHRSRGHRSRGHLRGPGFLPVPPGFPAPCGGRGSVAAWALVSAVNVLIWLAVVLGTGTLVYPWWIWVAGPWGLVLAFGALGRGSRRPSAL